ncbi:SGNH/GDSL hydrolase family protein [Salisaeta longa]|uniref:SGNH/GDSL hydrolase family protein n=1 Tax=Salisaeta longa TaxID=503170 RepID=UPI0003B7B5A4|nr:SGNH/GDSL hydrolase family protein [Salisaeta longa]
MTIFRRLSLGALALLLAGTVALSGCDGGELLPPDPRGGDLFSRYVSLGNSITAGFQSNGININTQREAYPVLVAQQMGTEFNLPELALPGCPPPLTNALTGAVVGGDPTVQCALRRPPIPTTLNNVAVPGANVASLTTNSPNEGAATNALTQFVLGGRTQAEAALDVEPTFATVWIGNNDVLNGAIVGTDAAPVVTSFDAFQDRYTAAINTLKQAERLRGAVLFGVADPTIIPYLSPGVSYFGAEQQINQFGAATYPTWGSFDVANSCAPQAAGGVGDQILVPFRYGFQGLFLAAAQGASVTLDCANDAPLAQRYPQLFADGPLAAYSLLTGLEIQTLRTRVAQFNGFIQQQAQANGWAYLSPNPDLRALYAVGTNTPTDPTDDVIPKFPNITDPANLFGPYFSLDGIHPSGATHQLIAQRLIQTINAQYPNQSSIPDLSGAIPAVLSGQ